MVEETSRSPGPLNACVCTLLHFAGNGLLENGFFLFSFKNVQYIFLFIFQAVKEQKKRFEKLRSEFSKHLARNLNNLFIYHVRVNLFFFLLEASL